MEIHEQDGTVIHTARAELGTGAARQTRKLQDGNVEKIETTLDIRRAGKDKVKFERNYRRWLNDEAVVEIQFMSPALSTSDSSPQPVPEARREGKVTRVKYKGETISPKE